MNKIPPIVFSCLIVGLALSASGETWHVDGSAAEFGDGRSWEAPLEKIQQGINAASDGDTVIVAPQTKPSYRENIHFKGKNITLTSSDPLDPGVVAKTVIDGSGAGPVVTFSGTEGPTCVLSGFTIKNGTAESGGGICGGTWENRTLATIRNNAITSNWADYGGGIAYCDGLIRENTISGNSAVWSGGGLIRCDGNIRNNTISRNISDLSGGGGLCSCEGTIEYNLICENEARDPSFGVGGGLFNCDGAIAHNIISGNSARYSGGGLNMCRGTVRCNTIVGNWAGNRGGGVRECAATIVYCIISGNTAVNGDPEIGRSRTPEYSYIGSAPRFVDADGPDDDLNTYEDNDYRLLPDSPCIDAGRNEDWMWHATDLGGNPRILTGASSLTVDIGAYEYVPTPAVVNTWYVDGSVLEAGAGTSWELAFEKIQEGIDAASDGDSVIVAEGTYVENIEFKGKNIILRSKLEGEAISATIIDGNQSGSVVTFLGTENETCVLRGFTIRNGKADKGGGIQGAGLGVGISYARIENNVIANNSADHGGGLSDCAGLILNNTIVSNSAAIQGSALYNCSASIHNCLIWGNTGGDQVFATMMPTYSCIQDSSGGGQGNIVRYPYFVDTANGDYHLRGLSPCVDAGNPAAGFSHERDPNGGRINMGAFGNTSEAASRSPDGDGDGLPDDWETEFFGHLAHSGNGDPDGDLISNLHEYYRGSDPAVREAEVRHAQWYVDGSVKTPGDGISWDSALKRIQEGIDAAWDGDTVFVAKGTYGERIWFNGKNITVRSTDPLDRKVVTGTIVDGNQGGSVVTFSGTEDEVCVLSGFTIRNGKAENGGGICGGTPECRTLATIEHNVIVDNFAEMGGGLVYCDGRICNNRILANTTCQTTMAGQFSTGGGLASCNGLIESNTISGNSANRLGGALVGCNGIIRNNVISGNFAPRYGSYDSYAGGVAACYGPIQNNTIVDNSAWGYGGLVMCHGPISGCIIWQNTNTASGAIDNLANCRTPEYSCVQNDCSGDGSICDDPRFASMAGGDYHLRADSPCIDAGLNEEWMVDAVDLDGNPRIWNSTVDMGAYEYGSFPFEITEAVADGESVQLTWNSRPGDNYTIFSCTDAGIGAWTAMETVPSQGATTTWTHSNIPANRQLFYRIEID